VRGAHDNTHSRSVCFTDAVPSYRYTIQSR